MCYVTAGGQLLGYYLKEETGWSMDIAEVKKKVDQARDQGIAVRALVFINPGTASHILLQLLLLDLLELWLEVFRLELCLCTCLITLECVYLSIKRYGHYQNP